VVQSFLSVHIIMNLYDSLKFVFILQRMNGVTFLKRVNTKELAITKSSSVLPWVNYLLYISFVFVMLFSGAYTQHENEIKEVYALGAIIIFLLSAIQWSTFVVIVVITLLRRHDELKFYQKLYEFDEVMLKNFNSDFMYEKIKKQSSIVAAGITFFCFLLYGATLLMNVATDSNSKAYVIFIPFILQMSMLLTIAYGFYYCTYLLKIRFQVLQTTITMQHRNLDEIKLLFKLYKKLHSLISLVNTVYGLKELLNILNDFVVITVELFFIFTTVALNIEMFQENWSVPIFAFCWILPHSLKVFMVCFGSHTTLLEVIMLCFVFMILKN
jgi:hypothetical protein